MRSLVLTAVTGSDGRPLGHLEPERLLDDERDPELPREAGEPVVSVGQREDLPVVTSLEELLRAPVDHPDDRVGVDDRVAGDVEPKAQGAVPGRVARRERDREVGPHEGVRTGPGLDPEGLRRVRRRVRREGTGGRGRHTVQSAKGPASQADDGPVGRLPPGPAGR